MRASRLLKNRFAARLRAGPVAHAKCLNQRGRALARPTGPVPALILAAGVLLAGCIPAPPRPAEPPQAPTPPAAEEAPAAAVAPPPPPPRVSDSDRLLYYYEYLLGLPPEDLVREAERTQRFFGQHRSDFALLQLVVLKVLPRTTPRERAQAIELLAQYLKDSGTRESDLEPIALLLNNLLTEQQQQQAELQTQAQKLKEEARRYDDLKQKLDALIETERKMLERTKPTRTQ